MLATTVHQQTRLGRLNALIEHVWSRNAFYTSKWADAQVEPRPLYFSEELLELPLTTRAELLTDQRNNPPLGSNLSCSFGDIVRVHRSSGTTGAPIYWGDDARSWEWVVRCSEELFRMARITPADRVFFALRFGQSSGPWIMYEGACKLGCCCSTAGTGELLDEAKWLLDDFPTVLVGNPWHLRRLGDVLRTEGTPPDCIGLQKLILTGESVSDTDRQRLCKQWDAECFNRYGLTEAGPVACECTAHPGGMHILESGFIAEVIDPLTAEPVRDGELGELVLTTLGRVSQPIVRYRTGDFVRLLRDHQCPCARTDPLLVGGVSRHRAMTAQS